MSDDFRGIKANIMPKISAKKSEEKFWVTCKVTKIGSMLDKIDICVFKIQVCQNSTMLWLKGR
jgi:hypothetical protein